MTTAQRHLLLHDLLCEPLSGGHLRTHRARRPLASTFVALRPLPAAAVVVERSGGRGGDAGTCRAPPPGAPQAGAAPAQVELAREPRLP
eukprot:709145-Prorocentrum_minimum.AAC.1